MEVKDIIYGTDEIGEGVLLELINSAAFQRLKHICQQGVPKGYIQPTEPGYSRYEHSIGVMLILKRLGAPLEEQAAGLLHDVSHTAFSHIVDYVFGTGSTEGYQDSIHASFFKDGTELAQILERHNMDPARVSNPELYGLLERSQPEVCADRFDYTLRYFALKGDAEFAKKCVDSITTKDGVMVFGSFDTAREFAIRHCSTWNAVWGGYGGEKWDMGVRWYLFSEALKTGIETGVISKEDFSKTDQHVMGKMEASDNKKIKTILNMLKGRLEVKEATAEPRLKLSFKFRYVDPLFTDGESVKRVTDVDLGFKNMLAKYKALNDRGSILLESIAGVQIPL